MLFVGDGVSVGKSIQRLDYGHPVGLDMQHQNRFEAVYLLHDIAVLLWVMCT